VQPFSHPTTVSSATVHRRLGRHLRRQL